MTGKLLNGRTPSAPGVRAGAGASDSVLRDAARAVVENLEGRQLFAADPLALQNHVQALPFVLDFDREVEGLHDKDGQGIGFTRVQTNRGGTAASYVPALLDLRTDMGVLNVTTSGTSTAGSNFRNDNTMVNAVETFFDATTSGFVMTVRIRGPLGFINLPSEQAGIFFGPDQDNYIKLVAIAREEGPRLQFLDEQTYNGVYTHALNSIVDIGKFSNMQTLDLRLEGDVASGRVRAYYAINGSSFNKMPQELQLFGEKRAAFFTATARAGLITLHKNDTGPMTVAYDRFEILKGQALAGRPSVTRTRPGAGETDIPRDAFIAADLNLPNAGIDTETLNATTVKLYRSDDLSLVPAVVNTSGGGDTIVLQPQVLLEANTQYTFEVTDGVRDNKGGVFIPYTATFTTGMAGGDVDPSLSMEKIKLPATYGEHYTSLAMGPGNTHLWAGTMTGRLLRFPINADGTLGTATVYTTLQDHNVGQRLITGFVFDPASTAANPILYVNHGFNDIVNAPDWSSKMTKVWGPNLENVRDLVVGLPRAAKDHLTNQPSFGPDGAIYFNQGSMSAMGAPDIQWGMRAEHLLSAAVLRVDLSKLPANAPLDVKTEAGGTYNPFAPGAALTIYATGVRNAWDLVWTTDGKLYTATNGSAAGGATPSGGGVIGSTRVDQTMNDYLYLVQQGGYYGQPNPKRSEWVLNGGNPTANVDPAEVPGYAIGTRPDANWRGNVFDFGKNRSPNGMIEYKNTTAFNGALAGKLMVVRYSGGDDIVLLTRGTDGHIARSQVGIAGMRDFADPLDLVENTVNGHLYVAEYAESDPTMRRITLLRPIPAGAKAAADKTQLVFNDVTAAGSSPTQSVRITNNGTVPLSFPPDGFTILDDGASPGNDAGLFKLANLAVLPDVLEVGESVDVQVAFTAANVALESAFLQIKSNDATNPPIRVQLRGVGTAGVGGANEPSLARILRAFNIPTVVGDGPNDAGEATTEYPRPADLTTESRAMPRLIKAGGGQVTVELLASMGKAKENVTSRVGYYTPGNAADRTELFMIDAANAQQVTPSIASGTLSFDPGTKAFGLYGIFPSFQDAAKDGGMPRVVFSEDALNTWEANAANRQKVFFFPLRTANGGIVPDAYAFAMEEFDTASDANDVVAIIRNVCPAAAGPELGLENADGFPFSDRLVFNRIQNPDNSATLQPTNEVHDTATLVVHNTGTEALVLSSVTIQGTTFFQLVAPVAPNTVIQPGDALPIKVTFISQVGDIRTGTLTINSNDADERTKVVELAGFWQAVSEQNQEPSLYEMMSVFGLSTRITYAGELLTIPGREGEIRRTGDEVLSPYWRKADTSAPVTVRQLAAFHNQGSMADLFWHARGSNTVTTLFTGSADYGQSILPLTLNNAGPAFARFNPAASFGFRIDGKEWSDPTKNIQPEGHPNDQGHHVRFWIARDRQGNVIPDTYVMGMDYAGINYDYNDNVFLITNVKPDTGPSAPTGLTATAAGSVSLNWADNTEPNLAGYNVYRATSPAGPWVAVNRTVLPTSAFNDVFAPVGVTSYYRVVAVDTSGTESPPAEISALRAGDNVPPAKPVAPTGTGSNAGVTLDWADNTEDDLSGYNVLRASSANGTYKRLNSGPVTTSSFVDITAPAGSTSYYRIVAVDDSGNPSPAASLSATRPIDPNAAPAAPGNVAAAPTAPNTVTLTWASAGNGVRYMIERRILGSNTWGLLATNVSGTSFTDSNLSGGTTYEYRISAVGSGGVSSPPSTPATATTDNDAGAPGAPTVPTSLAAVATAAGELSVSWFPSPGASSYRLERRVAGTGAFVEIAAGLTFTTFQDTGVSPTATYEYRVRAENGSGLSGYSPVTSGSTSTAPKATGTFTGADVGAPAPGGASVTVTDGADYDVTGGGPDIGGASDGFHFVSRQISGDFDVKVRLTELLGADPAAMAGLMARESLATSGANVFMGITAGNGFRFAHRASAGGDTNAVHARGVALPNTWVRLRRVGDTFIGYMSANGADWTQVGARTIDFASTIRLGMAVSSRTAAATASAKFRELGNVAPPRPPAAAELTPAAPTGLVATAASSGRVNLAWSAAARANSYRIERREAGGRWQQIAVGVTDTTYSDTGRNSRTTYEYRVRAENATGRSAFGNLASATTPVLGASYSSKDIGSPKSGSTNTVKTGTDFDVTAGGANIYGTADSFRFVSRQITGDFDMRVKVAAVSGPEALKAGLMARASLDANSANVFNYATKTEFRFTRRANAGGSTTYFRTGQASYPDVWLRLVRKGDVFTGFASTDGVTWTQTSFATQSMPATLHVGMAASAGHATQTASVQFRSLSST